MRVKKPLIVTLSIILGFIFIVLLIGYLFNVSDYGIAFASFGATIFMILSSKRIEYKKIFGAYLIGVLIGFLFSKFSIVFLNSALAVISSVVALTLLEFQHAPAIGMTISMVLNHFSLGTLIFVLLSIFTIIGITILLKSMVNDPEKIINFVDIEKEKIKWDF